MLVTQRVEPAHGDDDVHASSRAGCGSCSAKLLAGVLLTAFVIAFALVVGLVVQPPVRRPPGPGADWTFGWSGFAGFLITQTFAMLGGFALACLLLNTPAAIVVYFVYKCVLPGAVRARVALMAWFYHLAPWIDFQAAQNQLYDMPLTGAQWCAPGRSAGSSGSPSRSRSGCGGSGGPR